jgi:FkbM family methyltransferase
MDSYTIPSTCTHVKIDVGLSYGANQSSCWLDTEPDVMVFGFEPHPGSVANIYMGDIKLRHPSHAVGGKPLDKKHINSGRMHIFNVALGNVDKVETMNLYMNSKDCGTSSLFTHDEKFLGPIEQVLPVPVYSLKMFFDTFPWNKFEYIDYIKIDAQGSDLNIIKGAGDYLKERVVFVTAEPDGYQYIGADDCNASNIVSYMTSQGFIQVNHPNTNDPTFLNSKFRHLKDNFISQK